MAAAQKHASSPATLLEAVRHAVERPATHYPSDMVRPAAILWTDRDRQWSSIIPQLRKFLPQLLVLGDYAPEQMTGPAIWLRCVIEQTLPAVELPPDWVPVIYLPGISRQTLRAVQECPAHLKPLVELQYRGACWTQRSGNDWSVEAFLASDEIELDLDVARDAATRQSLLGALSLLAETPLAKLKGRRLDAEFLDELLIDDTVRDLLSWLSDPTQAKAVWSSSKWSAFRSRCMAEYGKFDPDKDGELLGGEVLGRRDGAWSAVWKRFAESPALYPGIPELLRRAIPADTKSYDQPSSWPQHNEEMEAELRQRLVGLENAPAPKTRGVVLDLERAHGPRREWVWAKLGHSPLARSLEHLKVLADHTFNNLGGATPDDMATRYADDAWQADAAVLAALAAVKSTADVRAVCAAVRSLYLPWLRHGAEHLQQLLESAERSVQEDKEPDDVKVNKGSLIFFVDGLRLDVANRLVERMRTEGWQARMSTRWAGLPTVTATAKPAVSPVAGKIRGAEIGEDFLPDVEETGQALTTDRFRKLLTNEGYQYISQDETGDSADRGWTEHGELDKLGHSLKWRLAHSIEDQIDTLLDRIRALLNAGWREIRIVTDHGWLLMPGGLPSVTLPKYLTESRWARCATIKGNSPVDVPTVSWHWNADVRVAVGPGIACFGNGNEYAHGGISLQECLIPDVTVAFSATVAASSASIHAVEWRGLRCRISIKPPEKGLTVALRKKVNDAASNISTPRTTDAAGSASLLIDNDDLEGSPIIVVLLDASGKVISKQPTIVGGRD